MDDDDEWDDDLLAQMADIEAMHLRGAVSINVPQVSAAVPPVAVHVAASVQQQQQQPIKWNCLSCTLENGPTQSACLVCRTPRGQRYADASAAVRSTTTSAQATITASQSASRKTVQSTLPFAAPPSEARRIQQQQAPVQRPLPVVTRQTAQSPGYNAIAPIVPSSTVVQARMEAMPAGMTASQAAAWPIADLRAQRRRPGEDHEAKTRYLEITHRSSFPQIDYEAAQKFVYPTNYPIREYQLTITEKALYHNTMVSLPTGLGKTLIASVVMYNFYRWFPQGKIVFMAPTKPLVAQQIKACHEIMGIPLSDTAELQGNVAPSMRKVLWRSKRVFFCTPQSMQNDLRQHICNAELIVCLVVDEAHRATGNYAYCGVIQEVEQKTPFFRILALSATPGAKFDIIQDVVRNLRISHIESRSADDDDVKKYTHARQEEVIKCTLNAQITEIKNLYLQVFSRIVNRLCNGHVIQHRDPEKLSRWYVLQARERFRQSSNYQQNRSAEADLALLVSLLHAKDLLTVHGLSSFKEYVDGWVEERENGGRLSWSKKELLQSTEFQTLRLSLQAAGAVNDSAAGNKHSSHPKLAKLCEVLYEHFQRHASGNSSTRAIVFTQFRTSVTEIVKLLEPMHPLIKVQQFVGQGASGKSKESKGQSQKLQQAIVKKFREGVFNVLVATCIAEEGLDIGEVDLIVSFDALTSPVRMIQRMGRTGRKRVGKVIILVTEGDEEKKLAKSVASAKTVSRALTTFKSKFVYAKCPRMIPTGITPELSTLEMQIPEFHASMVGGKNGQRTEQRTGDGEAVSSRRAWKLNDMELMVGKARFFPSDLAQRPRNLFFPLTMSRYHLLKPNHHPIADRRDDGGEEEDKDGDGGVPIGFSTRSIALRSLVRRINGVEDSDLSVVPAAPQNDSPMSSPVLENISSRAANTIDMTLDISVNLSPEPADKQSAPLRSRLKRRIEQDQEIVDDEDIDMHFSPEHNFSFRMDVEPIAPLEALPEPTKEVPKPTPATTERVQTKKSTKKNQKPQSPTKKNAKKSASSKTSFFGAQEDQIDEADLERGQRLLEKLSELVVESPSSASTSCTSSPEPVTLNRATECVPDIESSVIPVFPRLDITRRLTFDDASEDQYMPSMRTENCVPPPPLMTELEDKGINSCIASFPEAEGAETEAVEESTPTFSLMIHQVVPTLEALAVDQPTFELIPLVAEQENGMNEVKKQVTMHGNGNSRDAKTEDFASSFIQEPEPRQLFEVMSTMSTQVQVQNAETENASETIANTDSMTEKHSPVPELESAPTFTILPELDEQPKFELFPSVSEQPTFQLIPVESNQTQVATAVLDKSIDDQEQIGDNEAPSFALIMPKAAAPTFSLLPDAQPVFALLPSSDIQAQVVAEQRQGSHAGFISTVTTAANSFAVEQTPRKRSLALRKKFTPSPVSEIASSTTNAPISLARTPTAKPSSIKNHTAKTPVSSVANIFNNRKPARSLALRMPGLNSNAGRAPSTDQSVQKKPENQRVEKTTKDAHVAAKPVIDMTIDNTQDGFILPAHSKKLARVNMIASEPAPSPPVNKSIIFVADEEMATQDQSVSDCCSVCRENESYEDDPIVFCDGCDLAVHQFCYGLATIPNGQWLCDWCASRSSTGNGQKKKKQSESVCHLCPVRGGAVRRTVCGHWVHVQCFMWIPELTVDTMDGALALGTLKQLDPDRNTLSCSICHSTKGKGIIQCAYKKCLVAFHVSCASFANYAMVQEEQSEGETVFLAFCTLHRGKSSTPTNKLRRNAEALIATPVVAPGGKKASPSALLGESQDPDSAQKFNKFRRLKRKYDHSQSQERPSNASPWCKRVKRSKKYREHKKQQTRALFIEDEAEVRGSADDGDDDEEMEADVLDDSFIDNSSQLEYSPGAHPGNRMSPGDMRAIYARSLADTEGTPELFRRARLLGALPAGGIISACLDQLNQPSPVAVTPPSINERKPQSTATSPISLITPPRSTSAVDVIMKKDQGIGQSGGSIETTTPAFPRTGPRNSPLVDLAAPPSFNLFGGMGATSDLITEASRLTPVKRRSSDDFEADQMQEQIESNRRKAMEKLKARQKARSSMQQQQVAPPAPAVASDAIKTPVPSPTFQQVAKPSPQTCNANSIYQLPRPSDPTVEAPSFGLLPVVSGQTVVKTKDQRANSHKQVHILVSPSFCESSMFEHITQVKARAHVAVNIEDPLEAHVLLSTRLAVVYFTQQQFHALEEQAPARDVQQHAHIQKVLSIHKKVLVAIHDESSTLTRNPDVVRLRKNPKIDVFVSLDQDSLSQHLFRLATYVPVSAFM